MPDLPARLVHQAAEAIARAQPDRDGTLGEVMSDPSYWTDEARAAVASVLDLVADEFVSVLTVDDLRALAREVREGT